MFKVLNNLAPSYLTELLRVYEPARRLRSSSDKWRFAIEPYNLWTQSFFSHCPPTVERSAHGNFIYLFIIIIIIIIIITSETGKQYYNY